MDAVAALYAHHVRYGTATFETEAPSAAAMQERLATVHERGLPWLVLEADGRLLGYAYCDWFKPRPAFRFSAEDSIYLAPDAAGQGHGTALLRALLAAAEQAGVRRMIAVIGDSANAGSIGVHRRCGFVPVGVLPACGWKLGRWLDVVLMERPLGAGSTTLPQA